jgi:uncharacterized protein YhfF
MTKADEFWIKFIKDTKRSPEDRCSGDLKFEAKDFKNDELLALVLSGTKKAFFTSLPTFIIDQEPLPLTGELYLVFDKNDNPQCVIEITSVDIIPYINVTNEQVVQEGEDASLEEWREKEREYLEDEGAIVGFDFSPDIKLVYQTFNVIYRNI